MRYRDQPTVEVETRVSGDPAEVWRAVTDITLPTRCSDELRSVEWLEGADRVEVGARFRGHNENDAIGAWTTECTVIEVEPERRWVWTVEALGGVLATWGFEVDPGREAVTVRQWARMGPGRSGVTMIIDTMPDKEGRIVAGRLAQWRAGMEANLAAVKAAVEGAPVAEAGP